MIEASNRAHPGPPSPPPNREESRVVRILADDPRESVKEIARIMRLPHGRGRILIGGL
jgi:hypothetical protein